jgi:diguanylate cyclase (GGDEF)-like protein
MAVGGTDRWLPSEGETPRETLRRLCAMVRDLLGAERVTVWLHEPTLGTAGPYVGVPERPTAELARRVQNLRVADHELLREVIVEQRTVEVDDPASDPRVPDAVTDAVDLASFRLFPLIAGGVAGMLTVEPLSVAGDDLDEALPFVAAAAAQAAVWRQSEARRRRAELLLDVIEATAAQVSLDEALGTACERLAGGLDAERASIFLRDDSGRLAPRVSRFVDARLDETQWHDLPDPDVPFRVGEAVVATGAPIVFDDTSDPGPEWDAEDLWWAERSGVRSAVAVPIAEGAEVTGVLALESAHPRRFTDEHVRLATAVGIQLATLIERARVDETRGEQVRAANAVRRLLEAGSVAEDVREAAEVLARVLHETLATEHAIVYLRDEEGHVSELLTFDVDPDYQRILLESVSGEDGADHVQRMVREGVLLVDDARASDVIPAELVEALHLRSYVSLPVLAPDRPLGIIECGTTRAARSWSDADRRLVEQLALEGSLVLEAAALREADRQRLDDLSHRAFHDALTGLPNRTLLVDRIQHALARAERNPEAVAVLFVDLDRFKPINDVLGHDVGDDILIEVSRRIESSLRPGDTVARLAGDEFVVVLEDITSRAEAAHVASRIVEELNRPYEVVGDRVTMTASVGIAFGTPGEVDAEDLVRRADMAMYRVKSRGGGDHAFYDLLGASPAFERLRLEHDLEGAVERGEFTLRYQTIHDLEASTVLGVEALLRWGHPRIGTVGPYHFLPVAEEVGAIVEIGAWSLHTACEEVNRWRSEGLGDILVSVNLSPRQLYVGDVRAPIRDALDRSGLPPDSLVVEVSERTVLQDVDAAAEALSRFRDLGVRTALDDFGSANASLRDVQRLPIDVLKIDRTVVAGISSETGDGSLLRAIVELADHLGLDAIAEGVETELQLDVLRRAGCRFGQGYLLQRPAEPDQVRGLLARQKQAGSASVSSLG